LYICVLSAASVVLELSDDDNDDDDDDDDENDVGEISQYPAL